MTLNFIPRCS